MAVRVRPLIGQEEKNSEQMIVTASTRNNTVSFISLKNAGVYER